MTATSFRFTPLDFVVPLSTLPGARHNYSVCELAHSGTAHTLPLTTAKRRAQPGQLLVLSTDSLVCVAASANLIERDADRRIGPALAPCPPTHLNACTSTVFPIISALRTTRASDWQLLAVDSFLQARDDQGVAQFIATDTPPSLDGLRRGPIIVYAVRVFYRDATPSAPTPTTAVVATGSAAAAPITPAAPAGSAGSAAGAPSTPAANNTSTATTPVAGANVMSPSGGATTGAATPVPAAQATTSTATAGGAAGGAAGAPTLGSEKSAPSLAAMAGSTSMTNVTAVVEKARYFLIVHGARSRIDEPVGNLSGDWEQVDLGFVPIGIAHVELPRSGGGNSSTDATTAATDATSVDAVDDSNTTVAVEPDNDSDTASQRSRGSTASSQRRRRPGSVLTATTAGTSGSIGASSGSNGRRCAIVVLGGDGLIHCFAQTETGMRFVEFTTGVWWIPALRSAGQMLQRGREPVLSPGAASTPVVSTTNTNAPTTPVVSRPGSPRLGGHFNPLESLLVKAADEKDFFAPPSAPPAPASGGVPLCIDFVETYDADQYAFAVGFHSGLVRVLLAPTVDIEAEFGDGDNDADNDAEQQLRFTHWFDGPIAAVCLFRDRTAAGDGAAPVHLVAVCALGYAVAFDDVLRHGLSKPQFLPQSDNFDALLCCRALDANQDGRNELLIGTFSGHILVYARGEQDGSEWRLVDDRVYASAVHSIVPINLLGGQDSAQLAVSTADGIQLLVANANISGGVAVTSNTIA